MLNTAAVNSYHQQLCKVDGKKEVEVFKKVFEIYQKGQWNFGFYHSRHHGGLNFESVHTNGGLASTIEDYLSSNEIIESGDFFSLLVAFNHHTRVFSAIPRITLATAKFEKWLFERNQVAINQFILESPIALETKLQVLSALMVPIKISPAALFYLVKELRRSLTQYKILEIFPTVFKKIDIPPSSQKSLVERLIGFMPLSHYPSRFRCILSLFAIIPIPVELKITTWRMLIAEMNDMASIHIIMNRELPDDLKEELITRLLYLTNNGDIQIKSTAIGALGRIKNPGCKVRDRLLEIITDKTLETQVENTKHRYGWCLDIRETAAEALKDIDVIEPTEKTKLQELFSIALGNIPSSRNIAALTLGAIIRFLPIEMAMFENIRSILKANDDNQKQVALLILRVAITSRDRDFRIMLHRFFYTELMEILENKNGVLVEEALNILSDNSILENGKDQDLIKKFLAMTLNEKLSWEVSNASIKALAAISPYVDPHGEITKTWIILLTNPPTKTEAAKAIATTCKSIPETLQTLLIPVLVKCLSELHNCAQEEGDLLIVGLNRNYFSHASRIKIANQLLGLLEKNCVYINILNAVKAITIPSECQPRLRKIAEKLCEGFPPKTYESVTALSVVLQKLDPSFKSDLLAKMEKCPSPENPLPLIVLHNLLAPTTQPYQRRELYQDQHLFFRSLPQEVRQKLENYNSFNQMLSNVKCETLKSR